MFSHSAAPLWATIASLFPQPRRSTMVPNSFGLLFAPERDFDTETFLHHHWNGVLSSDNPETTLNSFPLQFIEFKKLAGQGPQHESLVISTRKGSETQKFGLERLASSHSAPPDSSVDKFLRHPESRELIETLLKACNSVPLPLVAAAGVAVATPVLGIPTTTTVNILVPLAVSLSSACPSPCPSPRPSPCPSPRPSPVPSPIPDILPRAYSAVIAPDYSFVDKASMRFAQVLQACSETPVGAYISNCLNAATKDMRAIDIWMGQDRLETIASLSEDEMSTFYPSKLNLFHIALLADVVHQAYPLYSLFMRQCYWFANTIFFAAQMIDRELQSLSPDAEGLLGSSNDNDEVYLPFHLFAPKGAGRWKGIQISGCQLVVLNIVVKKFRAEFNIYRDLVCLLFPSKCILLTKLLTG